MEKACTYFLQLLCILSIGCSLIEGLLVEETSHVRLSCLSTTDSQRLVVTYSNNTKETLSIFTSSECNVPRSDIRCITLDNVDNTLLIVELEVSNQTRTIVSYSCGGGKVTNITFYAKPSNVSCGPPVLDESESNVLVTCTVGKIYPQPGCVFYDMSNNSVVERLMTNVRYVQWGSPVYYSAECTIQITLINQTQVHEEILVNVYPNVDNNNGSIYGVNYTAVHQLKIDLNKSYQCKAAPLTTEPNGLTFYPQFAFGPQSLLVDFNETTVDLCSAESKTIPINVWVSKSDVSPDIRVKTTVEIAARSSDNRNDDYDFSVRTNDNPSSPNINSTIYLTVTSGGKYIVTASFLNIIFNDFKAVTNVNVIVREPPPKQPIFIINGGEHMKEGITTSNINLTCYAPGGYPEVSEITISCIGRTITKSGNTLTVKMDFEKKDNGSVCVCQATHKSGCYTNNVASLIINITYIVNITTFTVKNQTSLEVPEGQNVPLSCSVESYPRPVISINKKDVNANDNMLLTSEPTEVAANIWQSQYTILSVRCDDVHTYTCRATHLNSYMTVESNVSFTVKCHFRLKNGAIVKEEIGAVLGHDLVFTLEVLGNPQPSKYELLKGLRKHPLENGSFNVGFTPLYVPFGILKLTLFNVQREDLTLFTLVIDNGMQENMTYNFLLFEALSEQQSANTGAIVGGSVGGVIFILMTIIFLNRRRCRKPSTEDLREPDGVEMNRNSNVEPETANPPYEEPAPEVVPRKNPNEVIAGPLPDLGPKIIPRKKNKSEDPEDGIAGPVNVLGPEVIPRKKINSEQQEEVIAGPFNDIEPRSYQSLHDGSFDGVNERMDSNSNDLSEQNSEHNDDEAININSNGLSVPASQHHDEIQEENTSVKAFHFSDMIDQSNSLENNSTLVHSKPPGSVNFLVSTETLKELQIQDDDNMSAESTSLQKSEEQIVPFNDGIFESPLPKTNSGDNEYDHPISNRSLQDKNFYKVPDRNSSLGTVKKLEDFLRPDGFGTLESIQTPNEVQQQDALEALNPSYPSSFNQNVNESAPQSSNLLQTQTNDSSV